MRFFPVLDFQYVVLALFMGLGAVLVLWICFRGYHGGEEERQQDLEHYPDGIKAGRGPVPVLLVLIYVGFVLWALGYALKVGIFGPPF
ncbi:MAG: hypothetical protein WHX93_06730 [bacterium]